ncbi:hypothetical protein N9W79_02070, partial [bacterium]|nr:hypothetical protein [bacterium]
TANYNGDLETVEVSKKDGDFEYTYTVKGRPTINNPLFTYRDPYTGKPGKHRVGDKGCSVKQNYDRVGIRKKWVKLHLFTEADKIELTSNFISKSHHEEDYIYKCTFKRTK